jgi:hypothetical protein
MGQNNDRESSVVYAIGWPCSSTPSYSHSHHGMQRPPNFLGFTIECRSIISLCTKYHLGVCGNGPLKSGSSSIPGGRSLSSGSSSKSGSSRIILSQVTFATAFHSSSLKSYGQPNCSWRVLLTLRY